MKYLRIITLLTAGLLSWGAGGVAATSVPQHPEMDNPEYQLDIVTNGYSRWWREEWDAGDNRFRFRLGSNNVTQWFVDEQLKFATDLVSDRLRFRFYHMRIKPYSTEDIGTNVLEFEGRVWRRNYLSVYARPVSDKREGSIGFMLQHRKAVNRFIKVSVEWPGVLRNFFEHYRDTSDSLLHIWTDRPVRFGVDVREQILDHVWIRALGEYTPDFVMGEEITETGEQFPVERAEGKALSGWVEYVVDPSRGLREQTALGVLYGYQRSRKSKDPQCGCSALDASVVAGGLDGATGALDDIAGGRDRTTGALDGSAGGLDRTTGALGDLAGRGGDAGLGRVPPTHFGGDLYRPTEEDSVAAWRDSRWHLSPYAWIVLTDRITLRANVRVGSNEIGIGNFEPRTFYTTNSYVVPMVGVRYGFGRSRAAVAEAGLVSEWRKLTEERTDDRHNRVEVRSERFDDHRLYLGFEYVFGDDKIVRLVEALELDAEDRGDFAIHDHGFFQVIFGF